jgi:hypothetical protein
MSNHDGSYMLNEVLQYFKITYQVVTYHLVSYFFLGVTMNEY